MEIGGSADAYTEPDVFEYAEVEGAETADKESEDTDLYEAAAEGVFMEISDRICACGEPNYPFTTTSQDIAVRADTSHSVYTFLLLLSRFGQDAGPTKNEGAKLFEEICGHIVMSFLGGKDALADAHVFGFPRRVACDGFAHALDSLCQHMAEGGGSRNQPTTPNQKDAKLDVVGWKSFRDMRKGRLIIFGQCATGNNWREKRSELISTQDWCSYWMKDRPAVWPLRAFFVPHRVGDRDWLETCVHGGLLFDRCRITSCAGSLPKEIADQMMAWSQYVTDDNRGN